jgi:threonine dehydrogenase-like Zn-dependent dehydrogenase
MKALVWKGGTTLDYEEVADPVAETDEEVVLDVQLAGICGSDLHGYRGHPGPRVPPLVLGHEAIGRFEGERFAVYPLVGCGTCERCSAGEVNLCPQWHLIGMHRAGVFAESVLVPRSTLVAVPAEMPDERAVLTEPLACAVGALAPYAIGPGSRVAVIGCGPIGMLAILLAASRGAEVSACDPLASRGQLALRLGASSAAATADELGRGEADLVVDAAGFEATWSSALSLVRSGGDVVVLGLGAAEGSFPMATLIRRGIRLRGHFAYSRGDFSAALGALETLEIDLGWCSTEPLSHGAHAFERLVSEPERYVKILLAPPAERD